MGISDTDKTDNLTCEINYDNFTCENYRFSNNHYSLLMHGYFILLKDCSLYNTPNNTCVLGNARFISRVKHDTISLVRCAHS